MDLHCPRLNGVSVQWYKNEPLFELSTSFSAIAFVEAYDDMCTFVYGGFHCRSLIAF